MVNVQELFDLSGRVAIVTGGSRGIGLAIAEGLAAAGAETVIASRNAGQAAHALSAKGLRVTSHALDVTSRLSAQELLADVLRDHGRVDILVNSAGVIQRKPIEDTTDAEWDAMMDTNLRGIFLCSQVIGREMIARRQGKIINISSNIVQVLQPLRGAYAVTKAAVSHLTRVMALEWAPYHVNVNAIAPSPTITDINRKYFEEHPDDLKLRMQSIPMGRLGDPQDYVGMAICLASRASDFVTGQTVFVDGGSVLI